MKFPIWPLASRIAGVILKTDTQLQGQASCDSKAILREEGKDVVSAIVIQLDVIQERRRGGADQEIGEIVTGKHAVEPVGAIVVSALEAQSAHGAQFLRVHPELEGVAALDPAQVVGKLIGPRLADRIHSVRRETCSPAGSVKIDLGKAVVPQVVDVGKPERLGEGLAVIRIRRPRKIIGQPETELVQQRGPERIRPRSHEHAHVLVLRTGRNGQFLGR